MSPWSDHFDPSRSWLCRTGSLLFELDGQFVRIVPHKCVLRFNRIEVVEPPDWCSITAVQTEYPIGFRRKRCSKRKLEWQNF